MELIEKHLSGKYQYVIATHVDKDHIHNHIVFNNVSYIDYHCYNSNKNSYQQIRQLSDDICREHNLDIIMEIDQDKKKKYPYATVSRYKNTYRDIIKNDIDLAVKQALDFDDYLQVMRDKNYDIRQGKYISYRHKKNGQERFIRDRSLGLEYLKDNLIQRIDCEFLELDSPLTFEPLSNRRLEVLIDMNTDKIESSPGLRHWVIKQNNNRMMETLNQMIRLGVGSYDQLLNFYDQLQIKRKELTNAIDEYKRELKGLQETKKILAPLLTINKENASLESYVKLTSEIEEVFKNHEVKFSVEFDKGIKVDEKLTNQLKIILDKNKKAENIAKTMVSSLGIERERVNTLTENTESIKNNYSLFTDKTYKSHKYIQR